MRRSVRIIRRESPCRHPPRKQIIPLLRRQCRSRQHINQPIVNFYSMSSPNPRPQHLPRIMGWFLPVRMVENGQNRPTGNPIQHDIRIPRRRTRLQHRHIEGNQAHMIPPRRIPLHPRQREESTRPRRSSQIDLPMVCEAHKIISQPLVRCENLLGLEPFPRMGVKIAAQPLSFAGRIGISPVHRPLDLLICVARTRSICSQTPGKGSSARFKMPRLDAIANP